MTKVLMTADTVGGVWTYALELARALPDHQFKLATMGAPLSPDQWAEVRLLNNVEVFQSTWKLEWMDEPWYDVHRAAEWLRELGERHRPDIVHLNGYVHGSLDWRSPVLMVAHSCVLSWWRAVKHEPAPASWNRYKEAVEQGLAYADLVVAPSRAMLDALVREYHVAAPMQVIYNARDARKFKPGEKEPIVFSAGRLWDEAKNIGALASIAGQLSWPCYAAGEGGTDGPMRWLGRLSSVETRGWFSRASIYALPARYEPFGLSVLEAALSGCALVLGDIPSLREIWPGAAVYVDPDDPEHLRSAVADLIANDQALRTLASEARHRALNFSPKRMASEYREAYRHLVEGRSVVARFGS